MGEDSVLWKVSLPDWRRYQVEAIALAGNVALLAGRVRPAQDAITSGDAPPHGFLWVKSRDAGKPVTEFTLDAVPAYDGLAVADRRVYVSMQDGTIACFGK